jgi:hypothetical protein
MAAGADLTRGEQRGGQRRRAVAELHPIHSGALAMQPGPAHRHPVGGQRRARADGDAAAARVLVDHEQRLGVGGVRSDAKSPSLTDREAVLAVVGAEHVAGDRHDLPGRVADSPVAGEKPGPVRAREKAQVLGVGLVGDG